MWDLEILGVDLYHIFAWLFLYSFLGWAWESCYVSVKERKLVNRGFVTGPVCTIYGVGAVSVYLILRPLEENLVLLYFGGVIVATALEYVTAIIMEKMFHTSWWDYSDKKFNFRGRICLESSVLWGFFSIGMFRVLHPAVQWAAGLVDERTGKIILGVIMVLYVFDFTFAMITASQIGKKLEQMERMLTEFMEHLQDLKIFASASEIKEALEPYRKSMRRLNIRERIDKYQEMMTEWIEKTGKREQTEAAFEKLRVVVEKISNIALKGNWNSRRLFRAYPRLRKVGRVREKMKSSYGKKKHGKDVETKK